MGYPLYCDNELLWIHNLSVAYSQRQVFGEWLKFAHLGPLAPWAERLWGRSRVTVQVTHSVAIRIARRRSDSMHWSTCRSRVKRGVSDSAEWSSCIGCVFTTSMQADDEYVLWYTSLVVIKAF